VQKVKEIDGNNVTGKNEKTRPQQIAKEIKSQFLLGDKIESF